MRERESERDGECERVSEIGIERDREMGKGVE